MSRAAFNRARTLSKAFSLELRPLGRDLTSRAVRADWFADEQVNTMLGYGRGPLGRLAAKEDLAQLMDGEAVSIYLEGEPVGYFGFESLPERSRGVRMSLFVAPSVSPHPALVGAVVEMLDRLFEKGVYRIEVETPTINEKGVTDARCFGFVQEGRKQNSWWMGDKVYDTAVLGLTKPRWKKVKKGA